MYIRTRYSFVFFAADLSLLPVFLSKLQTITLRLLLMVLSLMPHTYASFFGSEQ